MSKIDDGGPAFPLLHSYASATSATGLSVRDYFAGQVVAASIASFDRHIPKDATPRAIAHHAYRIADALLRARQETAA